MTARFAELPAETRMAVRDELEAHGHMIRDYIDVFALVAVARIDGSTVTGLVNVERIAEAHGLKCSNHHLFPLGSDAPPERLRHPGPYFRNEAPPGYWYYVAIHP